MHRTHQDSVRSPSRASESHPFFLAGDDVMIFARPSSSPPLSMPKPNSYTRAARLCQMKR